MRDINVDWAISLLEVFHNASKQCSSMYIPRSDQVWKSPLPNQLRLDVDAGYDSSSNKFSLGGSDTGFSGYD